MNQKVGRRILTVVLSTVDVLRRALIVEDMTCIGDGINALARHTILTNPALDTTSRRRNLRAFLMQMQRQCLRGNGPGLRITRGGLQTRQEND